MGRLNWVNRKVILIFSVVFLLVVSVFGYLFFFTNVFKFSADSSQSVVLLSDNFQSSRGIGGNIATDNEALSGNTVLAFSNAAPPTRALVSGCQALTQDYSLSKASANTLYTFSYGLKGTITGKLTMRIEWKEKNANGSIASKFVEKNILPTDVNSTNWTIVNKLLKTPTNFVVGSLVFKPVSQCGGAKYTGEIDSLAVTKIVSEDHLKTIGKSTKGDINAVEYTKSTIPLNIQIDKPLQGLNIAGSGTISDAYGYINAILQNKDGSENMISEDYNFDGKGKYSFGKIPVETALLDNVVPQDIAIYSNKADWNIDNITVVLKESKLDTTTKQMVTAASAPGVSAQSVRDNVKTQIRATEADNVATGLNAWFKANNQKATAKVNENSTVTYSAKKAKYGGSNISLNDQILNDYNSGYLYLGTAPTTDPSLPAAFSWTNIRGQNWVTSVKDQSDCGSCYAFGGVGQIEAAINLKYNQHIDANLSEQQAMCAVNSCSGGLPGDVLNVFSKSTLWSEELNPYNLLSENTASCNIQQPNISTPTLGWKNIEASTSVDTFSSEASAVIGDSPAYYNSSLSSKYMREIMQYGPIAVAFGEFDHVMLVVGWTTIDGKLTWIIKNSWGDYKNVNLNMEKSTYNQDSGNFDGGYVFYQTGGETWWVWIAGIKFSYHDPFPFHSDDPSLGVIPVSNIPSQLQTLAPQVQCSDPDGLGFYSWGIGSKPTTCPVTAPVEEACKLPFMVTKSLDQINYVVDQGGKAGYKDNHGTCQDPYTYSLNNGLNIFTLHLGQDALNKYKNYKWQVTVAATSVSGSSTPGSAKAPAGRGSSSTRTAPGSAANVVATGTFAFPNPLPLSGNLTATWDEKNTPYIGSVAQFSVVDASGNSVYTNAFTIK